MQFVRPVRNSLEPNSELRINADSEENYSAQNSRAECSDSSGGDRPVSHEEWIVFDAQLLLSMERPASILPGALQNPCYARALEWEKIF